ncbi:MAG: response regulator [Clostridia bacterium]|nr:response regulator [Clostridia bacterium]
MIAKSTQKNIEATAITMAKMPGLSAKWLFSNNQVLWLDANKNCLDFFGFSDDVFGNSVFPEGFNFKKEFFGDSKDKSQFNYTRLSKTQRGEAVWIKVSGSYFETIEEGEVYLVSIVDITRDKLNEENIKKKNTLLKLMGNGFKTSVCLTEKDFSFYEVDDFLVDILRFDSKEELLTRTGGNFLSLVHPEDLHYYQSKIETDLLNSANYRVEYRVIRSDGMICWIHEYGSQMEVDGKTRLVGILIAINADDAQSSNALARYEQSALNTYSYLQIGIVRFNKKPDGEYLLNYVNPACADVYGFDTVEDFTANWHNGVVIGELQTDGSVVQQSLDSIKEIGQSIKLTSEVYKQDGRIIYVDNLITLLGDDESGRKYVQIATNVTDKVLLEERNKQLQQQTELMENVNNTMPTGIIRLKERATGEFVPYMANPAAIKMLGFTDFDQLCQFRSSGVSDTIFSEDAQRIKESCLELSTMWETTVVDGRVYQPDGTIKYLRGHNTLIGIEDGKRVVQRILYDLTEQHVVEELRRKRHQDEFLDQIFTIISADTKDGYILFNLEDVAVEYISANFEKLTGVPTHNFKQFLSYFDGEYRVVNVLQNMVERRQIKPVQYLREAVHLATGEKRQYVATFYVSVLDGKNKGLLIISDKTEEILAKNALEDALHNAQVASKAKTEFLSYMSHDIRTPMNAIIGLTQLLQGDFDKPDQYRRHLTQLQAANAHMLELVNNVLDMSRIESGKSVLENAPFKIMKVLKEVDAVYSTQAEAKNIQIIAQYKFDENVEYHGDELRIKKVLLNLFSNAVKYTPNGGKIRLVAKVTQKQKDYDIVRFKIVDTGIGMSKKFLGNLYSPFMRETRDVVSHQTGTGLGMAIVKNLVDLMGGTILARSQKGVGTVFTVDLPLKPIENVTVQKDDAIPEDAISGVRFLIAEDNDINAEILTELLELEGGKVTRASDGEEAVKMFMESPEGLFDAILMDIQMPRLNGFQATAVIRACNHPQSKTIQIIAMTANAFKEDVNKSLASGMNAHVAKPIDMAELKRTVKRLLK